MRIASARSGSVSTQAMALAAVLAIASIEACGPGSGHPSAPPAGYRGEIRLERYHTYLPALPVSPFLFAQATFQGPDNTYLPAGDSIALSSTGVDIPMVRINALGKILYQKDPAGPDLPGSDFVPAATYSATSSGSHENRGVPAFELASAIRTPSAFTLLTPDVRPGQIDLDGSAPLDLTWTAGDGDYVLVIMAVASNNIGHYLSYKAADNGSFQIPLVGIQTLPHGHGSLTVERMIEGTLALPDGATGKSFGGDATSVRLVVQ